MTDEVYHVLPWDTDEDIAYKKQLDQLRTELERLGEAYDLMKDDFCAMSDELDVANKASADDAEQVYRLRQALEAVEWLEAGYAQRRCPWCKAYELHGHTDSCQRQQALKGGE